MNKPVAGDGGLICSAPTYAAIGLLAGATIALQIAIMRAFAVGSWAHFGSLVVSLAMLGVGLSSAIICIAQKKFDLHWQRAASICLVAFGPLVVCCNLLAQQMPFNAMFLIADPEQKWRLGLNFGLYLLPFIAGSTFLGVVFLKTQAVFNRVYFADLAGCGVGGLLFLGLMAVFRPADLMLVPVLLWAIAGLLWFGSRRNPRGMLAMAVACAASLVVHLGAPVWWHLSTLDVSDYKGVAYARKFPDSTRIYERPTPFGYLEVYGSSYFHFAPGLSDNAALNLPEMPANAYLGMYVDSDGPTGVIRDLPDAQTGYFDYLPSSFAYLLKRDADAFVVQFGGGISTAAALHGGAQHVTVAENNPAVLAAFRDDPKLRAFNGDLLRHPKVDVIDQDGRLFLAHTDRRYDVIDLSLIDSSGLSSPGGFAITEKYAYTREAMQAYMQALRDGGVLSVTLWNKEEPPKSVLRLYATLVAAARDAGDADPASNFFVVSSYLSTTTVLYQRGGFSPAALKKLRDHAAELSFDEIYSPGLAVDVAEAGKVLDAYREQILGSATTEPKAKNSAEQQTEPSDAVFALTDASVVPATTLARFAWQALLHNRWAEFSDRYVFDIHALSNDRPYFAAYVRPHDLAAVTDRLDLFQDEWGYLLLWATLGMALAGGLLLVALPVIFGWRSLFSKMPGKAGTMLYFACLGMGYIMVEVGLIAHFTRALGNPTVSATVLITGLLVFSGLGSLASERILLHARRFMPIVFACIAALLVGYALYIDRVLDVIGALPYGLRLPACFSLLAPPAFLMGMPMSVGMGWLARLKKERMFIWAWGVNGCLSVVGAALVPLIATAFGLSSVLLTAGAMYALAIPGLLALMQPLAADSGA